MDHYQLASVSHERDRLASGQRQGFELEGLYTGAQPLREIPLDASVVQ
jgi:hypothetical protein